MASKSPLDRAVVVGIVTDRQIVRAQHRQAVPLSKLRAEDSVARDPLVLNEDQSVQSALLRARRIRRAPVIDAGGHALASTEMAISTMRRL